MTVTNTIETYCEAWNTVDREKRLALLEASTTSDVTYVDPTVSLQGRERLAAHIDTVFARYPGSRIHRTSEIDHHHDVVRFLWRKILADGTHLAESLDMIELASDNRARRIIGFFGPSKALA